MYGIIEADESNQTSQIILLVSQAFEPDDLSEETVGLDVFLGDANLETKEMLPKWENYKDKGGDNWERLKSIVRKKTAIKILSSSERVYQRTTGDLTENKDIVKAKELIVQYRMEVTNAVSFLKNFDESSGTGTTSNAVEFFVVGG